MLLLQARLSTLFYFVTGIPEGKYFLPGLMFTGEAGPPLRLCTALEASHKVMSGLPTLPANDRCRSFNIGYTFAP